MKEMRVIQIEGYNFQRKKNRIIVELKNRDEQELGRVTELFLKEREAYRKKKGGHPLKGRWWLCQNHGCRKGIYFSHWAAKKRRNQAFYSCSLACQGKTRAGTLVSTWFQSLSLTPWRQAGWIVETARLGARAPRRVKKLEILLEWEREKVKEALKLIWANFPRAKEFIEKFIQKEMGEELRAFLNKPPT